MELTPPRLGSHLDTIFLVSEPRRVVRGFQFAATERKGSPAQPCRGVLNSRGLTHVICMFHVKLR